MKQARDIAPRPNSLKPAVTTCVWRTVGMVGEPPIDRETAAWLGLDSSAAGAYVSLLLPLDVAGSFRDAARETELSKDAQASYAAERRDKAHESHMLAVDPDKGRLLKGSLSPLATMPNRDDQAADWVGLGDDRYLDSISHAAGKHRSAKVERLFGGRSMTATEAEESRIMREMADSVRRGYKVLAAKDTRGTTHIIGIKRKRRR